MTGTIGLVRAGAARESSAAREIAEQVRHARESGTTLRITGSGHWLDAGAPCDASGVLSVAAHRGIVEYEPGDLVLTALAGTTLEQIERETAAHGQWLTLDPFGPPGGTIGATAATASAGPLAAAFGTPRDHLLGCEFVTGNGDVVRAGGRVVKNVAGFDLTRLVCGAWGTLGVITEVTVRLRARPRVDETVAITVPDDAATEAAWRWLRESPYRPLAAELLSSSVSRLLRIADRSVLLLRLGGNERLVRAARDAAATLGDVLPVPGDRWGALLRIEPAGSAVVRLSVAPARVAALWSVVVPAVERAGGLVHGTPSRGIVRCILPARSEAKGEIDRAAHALSALGSVTRLEERLPRQLWAGVVPRDGDALSREVRRAFDPGRLLNPGILGAAR